MTGDEFTGFYFYGSASEAEKLAFAQKHGTVHLSLIKGKEPPMLAIKVQGQHLHSATFDVLNDPTRITNETNIVIGFSEDGVQTTGSIHNHIDPKLSHVVQLDKSKDYLTNFMMTVSQLIDVGEKFRDKLLEKGFKLKENNLFPAEICPILDYGFFQGIVQDVEQIRVSLTVPHVIYGPKVYNVMVSLEEKSDITNKLFCPVNFAGFVSEE